MAAFVGYYRVSTQVQGRSGLGLEAQRKAVGDYVASVGGDLIAEFQEIESGALTARPQLDLAIKLCRVRRAMLVIAKLDRLARNVHFISQLLESGVEFIAADMPTANKLTVHIIAAMAEYERDVVSQRTKLALNAARARGIRLGNPNIRELSHRGVAASKERADTFAKRVLPIIEAHQSSGITSYAKLAMVLEATGVKTQRGGRWTAAGVRNIVLRGREISARLKEGKPNASALRQSKRRSSLKPSRAS
ncbi:MAG TPA: recombinase family protein [Lysobacter sp.]|nr:recombinase family protein [Lysobacter sp.]